ncbi:MAG TPA: dTDP-4-amino-4,6-dideoxygalactose transaminase [Thermotogota bacterium]|nr:dTDP-4-amino-4,6-dideoxygalactose transaminase [Thermotogota bacterium]HRW94004.1 dTDP-4-amino-4,6-dideoxygalactose transaminase [Thermotogota bacterium]
MIPFNRQNLFGEELEYIRDAFSSGKVSGDGKYTRLCSAFMEKRFGVPKVLLTTSGSHALELAALLLDLHPGDEVIMPSFTFVSTANAVVLRGAKPVFCDIRGEDLNMDVSLLEGLLTPRTRALFPVHYAGVACDMEGIMEVAAKNNLFVVEDAAQGLDASYKGRPLGTIGHLGCFSFHETKNVSMGEGGALLVNDPSIVERAEIIREKGTNRAKFFRGEVDKYTWVEVGSSFLPSEINAAVLWCQMEHLEEIQERRMAIFEAYSVGLEPLEKKGFLRLPAFPEYAGHNAHMFYVLLPSERERDGLMDFLKAHGVLAVFHYVPLHQSPFFRKGFGEVRLPETEQLSGRLLRLPLFFSLSDQEVQEVIGWVKRFFTDR